MITDVPGVLVGHDTDRDSATGCTVVLLPPGTTGGYVVAGAAPATRETHVLDPTNLVTEVHAVVLSGGSAFGLEAAHGVMRFLAARATGLVFAGAVVPIVVGASLFDLSAGRPGEWPDSEAGRRAAESAGTKVAEGRIGAGTGATVGKWAGADRSSPGGLGTASRDLGDGLVVGALVACNAVGSVVDEDGTVLAGPPISPAGEAEPALNLRPPPPSTVLSVVATTARLDKSSASHVARMATAGIARSVRPAHTQYDGDVVFCVATGTSDGDVTVVGAAAADLVAESTRRAVTTA